MGKINEDKQITPEIIERGLSDGDCDVRAAAMNACKGREVPIIRTFEPPEKVYKKCISGVIVIAEIPKDAQVRGQFGEKCRASKARIIDIEGDFLGEKIGISNFDRLTSYRIGDEIVVDDFDIGFETCAAGFHFFCSKDEAMRYRA